MKHWSTKQPASPAFRIYLREDLLGKLPDNAGETIFHSTQKKNHIPNPEPETSYLHSIPYSPMSLFI